MKKNRWREVLQGSTDSQNQLTEDDSIPKSVRWNPSEASYWDSILKDRSGHNDEIGDINSQNQNSKGVIDELAVFFTKNCSLLSDQMHITSTKSARIHRLGGSVMQSNSVCAPDLPWREVVILVNGKARVGKSSIISHVVGRKNLFGTMSGSGSGSTQSNFVFVHSNLANSYESRMVLTFTYCR